MPDDRRIGGRGGEFEKAAWDKHQTTTRANGLEITHTTGIAADEKQVARHGHRSRFSTWAVKDADTDKKLGKTTQVTDPSGKVVKESHGWTGTKNSFEEGVAEKKPPSK